MKDIGFSPTQIQAKYKISLDYVLHGMLNFFGHRKEWYSMSLKQLIYKTELFLSYKWKNK